MPSDDDPEMPLAEPMRGRRTPRTGLAPSPDPPARRMEDPPAVCIPVGVIIRRDPSERQGAVDFTPSVVPREGELYRKIDPDRASPAPMTEGAFGLRS